MARKAMTQRQFDELRQQFHVGDFVQFTVSGYRGKGERILDGQIARLDSKSAHVRIGKGNGTRYRHVNYTQLLQIAAVRYAPPKLIKPPPPTPSTTEGAGLQRAAFWAGVDVNELAPPPPPVDSNIANWLELGQELIPTLQRLETQLRTDSRALVDRAQRLLDASDGYTKEADRLDRALRLFSEHEANRGV